MINRRQFWPCFLCASVVLNACAVPAFGQNQAVTVAFSFSKRCLRDNCGDGAWGASIDRDAQKAIDGSGNACASMTTRQGSCGVGNGGRYFVQCKPGDGPKWAALALYDDQVESLTDGEGIGYNSEGAAQRAAVANCGRQGCHVVWSQSVDCGDRNVATGLDWLQHQKDVTKATATPVSGGIRLHTESRFAVIDWEFPWAWIKGVTVDDFRDQGVLVSHVKVNFNHDVTAHVVRNGVATDAPYPAMGFYFLDSGMAKAAREYFVSHISH